jgi:hypothetical protein
MPGNQLTTASKIQCPHGGQAILATKNSKVSAVHAPVLLVSDIHPIVGCPFTIGPKYSPCVRIEWAAGSQQVTIENTATLVKTSIGKCISAEGAIQGVAIIANTQTKTSAR